MKVNQTKNGKYAIHGDFSQVQKVWILWDWENDCPYIEEDGELKIFSDPDLAEEYRGRTATLCIHREDGTEDDKDVYKF